MNASPPLGKRCTYIPGTLRKGVLECCALRKTGIWLHSYSALLPHYFIDSCHGDAPLVSRFLCEQGKAARTALEIKGESAEVRGE